MTAPVPIRRFRKGGGVYERPMSRRAYLPAAFRFAQAGKDSAAVFSSTSSRKRRLTITSVNISHSRSKFGRVVPREIRCNRCRRSSPIPLPVREISRLTTCCGNFFPASIAEASIRFSMPAFLSYYPGAALDKRPPARRGRGRRLTSTLRPFTSNSVTCDIWRAASSGASGKCEPGIETTKLKMLK